MKSFNAGVADRLGHYVYRLIDPRDGQTFYIGRGQRNRVFAHIRAELKLRDDEDELSEKLETIKKIIEAGLEVIHVIHRHGMDEDTAAEVEAALIDATRGLTNVASGHGSNERGPAHVKELQDRYGLKIMEIDPNHRLLVIKVRQRSVDEKGSLYHAVRGCWLVAPERADRAEYVLAIVEGVCRGVFRPDGPWKPCEGRERRYEFDGHAVFGEIAERYVGKLIPENMRKQGMAAPFLYAGC